MKVMCIEEVKSIEPRAAKKGIKPVVVVGGIYNVKDVITDEEGCYYELQEHIGCMYAEKLFAPLSNIDETELAILRIQEETYH